LHFPAHSVISLTIVDIVTLPQASLEGFLDRKKSLLSFDSTVEFVEYLRKVLALVNEFVPAEAGSILLDDPHVKLHHPEANTLTFVAAFGSHAERLLGRQVSMDRGIASLVYGTKRPHLSNSPEKDPAFDPSWDRISEFRTRSVMGIPILIEGAILGVLELINAQNAEGFTVGDQKLIELFADYTAMSMQSLLDARRANQIAMQDELSTLFNDRYFHYKLTDILLCARSSGEDVALLFIDLDKFKGINDTYGHLAGSQCLREVGLLLKDTVHWPDGLLARYGGDEFTIVLPKAGWEEAEKVARVVRDAIAGHTFLSRPLGFSVPILNIRGVIGCSIGIATFKEDVDAGLPIEAQKDILIREADQAMYRKKTERAY
jgi:diguanylate cyclase (GGDEF)-like protein